MTRGGSGIDGRGWGWAAARMGGGVAVLAALLAVVGVTPFLDGLRMTGPGALAAAVAITFLTTVCSAWRWQLVARALAVELPLWRAVGACYRSQFLNSTLPGGVLGDVHRGLVHGRDTRAISRSVRSVVWERAAGQVVLAVVTVLAVALVPSPLRPTLPALLLLLVGLGAGGLLLSRVARRSGASRPARAARVVRDDAGLIWRDGRGPRVVLASVAAAAGYVAMFAVAAHSVGAELPPTRMVPLALVVLAAAAVPANLAGWGPREGAAAWAFAATGLGADTGVSVAVGYGVMALVASTPGVVLLAWGRRSRAGSVPAEPGRGLAEAAHG